MGRKSDFSKELVAPLPPAPDVSFVEIKSTRADAFRSVQAPDVPFSAIALTPAEKQTNIATAAAQLNQSTSQMREMVSYQRRLAQSAHSVSRAVALVAAGIAVFVVLIGVAYLCHLGASAILDAA